MFMWPTVAVYKHYAVVLIIIIIQIIIIIVIIDYASL